MNATIHLKNVGFCIKNLGNSKAIIDGNYEILPGGSESVGCQPGEYIDQPISIVFENLETDEQTVNQLNFFEFING